MLSPSRMVATATAHALLQQPSSPANTASVGAINQEMSSPGVEHPFDCQWRVGRLLKCGHDGGHDGEELCRKCVRLRAGDAPRCHHGDVHDAGCEAATATILGGVSVDCRGGGNVQRQFRALRRPICTKSVRKATGDGGASLALPSAVQTPRGDLSAPQEGRASDRTLEALSTTRVNSPKSMGFCARPSTMGWFKATRSTE